MIITLVGLILLTLVWIITGHEFSTLVIVLLTLAVVFGAPMLAWRLYNRWMIHVPGDSIGVVHRRLGRLHPGDIYGVSLYGSPGPQATVLGPNAVVWLPPFVYSVEFVPLVVIPIDSIGVVSAKVGALLPAGRVLGRHVECDYFQKGHNFLAGGGEQGPQLAVLQGGGRYAINPYMFDVLVKPVTYIRPGNIGVVVARVGENLPHGRPFGRHVECDYFQDGPGFLARGGQQGPQLAVLQGGNRYNINPYIFDVITEDNVESSRTGLTKEDLKLISLLDGNTGVVVVREGAPVPDGTELAPRIPGHNRFQLPWVFLERGGRQGTQTETLPGGADYAINPWFARVVRIPTRELILEWADKDGPDDRYDSALQPIPVTIEGHTLRVHLTQTLRIPAESAPLLVRRFGEQETADADQFGFVARPAPVKRFVERVLGSVVIGYFSSISAEYRITDFVDSPQRVQADLQTSIERKLEEWSVVATNTTIGRIEFEDSKFNDMRQTRVVAREQHPLLEQEERNARIRRRIELDDLEVDRARREVEVGTEVRVLIQMLGREQVAKERFIALLTKMGVPSVIASGGDADSITQWITPTALVEAINRAMSEGRGAIAGGTANGAPPAHPDGTQEDVPERRPHSSTGSADPSGETFQAPGV
ncbi:SPFH domain-containing protein [Sphaerisporangium sp. B11E5]|uniref:SPFH domain-containing protein n=1 Tax=Sphaerisporangium sp. B11E5 TaxID=3153563 RepID=UPI00325EF46F